MLASGVALGIAAGLAIRRTLRPLIDAQVRWLPVLIAALILRAIAPAAGGFGYPLYLVALAGTMAAAAANYRLAGAALVAVGGGMNLAVVLLNHGMPVDPAALAAVGAQLPRDPLHVVLGDNAALGAFADLIPVAVLGAVYSWGDVLIAIGGFLVPFALLARR